jgi:hypothetical protein
MKNIRIAAYQGASTIPVVGVSVENGDFPDAVDNSKHPDGDRNVIETAVPAEEVFPRMMPAGAYKGKSVPDLT